MSVKIMGLVWDLDNDVIDREEKYVLLAYADHADHKGCNIFPSIDLICQKTGYKRRAAQLITHSLEEKGFLLEDGVGPKGTNKWCIPLDEGGAKIAPVKIAPVQNSAERGAKSTVQGVQQDAPEPLKTYEPPKDNESINDSEASLIWEQVFDAIKPNLKGNHLTYVRGVKPISIDGGVLTLGACDELTRLWLQDRLTSTVNRLLIGILDTDTAGVVFEVAA